METLLHIVQTINFYLSDYILVVLLVGTGVFFSLRTRFVQVRCFGEGMRRVFGGFSMRGGRQKGGLSSFQALTTAIAAQVGTGNIIGSCSARVPDTRYNSRTIFRANGGRLLYISFSNRCEDAGT